MIINQTASGGGSGEDSFYSEGWANCELTLVSKTLYTSYAKFVFQITNADALAIFMDTAYAKQFDMLYSESYTAGANKWYCDLSINSLANTGVNYSLCSNGGYCVNRVEASSDYFDTYAYINSVNLTTGEIEVRTSGKYDGLSTTNFNRMVTECLLGRIRRLARS